jgi:anti-repressor protein
MEENLKMFTNSEFGEVRTLEVDNKIFFCGSDVAKSLGYDQPHKAIKKHCKEDGGMFCTVIDNMGRKQKAKFINEGNLYRLIINSKLKTAEKFEHWVFDEVLPQIHHTGGYIPVKQEDDDKTILAKAVSILQKTLDLKETQILELKPKADLCDSIIQSQGYVSFNVLAKSLRVGRNKLMNMLREKKILFKEGRNSLAYQYYCDKNYFKINYGISRNGKICGTTVISPTGIKYISDIIHNSNLEVAK